MEPILLSYFVHLCKTQNMTRTARELHVAQSAISQAIHRLEDQLSVKLFDRRGKGIVLNEYGKIYLVFAKRALEQLDDGRRALLDMQEHTRGHVRLGVFAGSILLPELLMGFRAKYPDISFELIQHGNDEPYDLSIAYAPNDVIPEHADILVREEIFLAVPTHHPLAGRKEINLHEAAGDGFICLTKGKPLRRVTDSICERVGFQPRIVFESDDPASVRGLISTGLGVAFFPSVSWYSLTSPSFVCVRIHNPTFHRTLVLQWNVHRYQTTAMDALRTYIIAFFRQLEKRAVSTAHTIA